jgi:hypothetical protein
MTMRFWDGSLKTFASPMQRIICACPAFSRFGELIDSNCRWGTSKKSLPIAGNNY